MQVLVELQRGKILHAEPCISRATRCTSYESTHGQDAHATVLFCFVVLACRGFCPGRSLGVGLLVARNIPAWRSLPRRVGLPQTLPVRPRPGRNGSRGPPGPPTASPWPAGARPLRRPPRSRACRPTQRRVASGRRTGAEPAAFEPGRPNRPRPGGTAQRSPEPEKPGPASGVWRLSSEVLFNCRAKTGMFFYRDAETEDKLWLDMVQPESTLALCKKYCNLMLQSA
jgi:hypothetical protein